MNVVVEREGNLIQSLYETLARPCSRDTALWGAALQPIAPAPTLGPSKDTEDTHRSTGQGQQNQVMGRIQVTAGCVFVH